MEPNGRNGGIPTHVTGVSDVALRASATGVSVSVPTAFPPLTGGVDAHPDGP